MSRSTKILLCIVSISLVAAAAVLVLRTGLTQRTADDVLREFGPGAEARLSPHFQQAGVHYPPRAAVLLAMKHEKLLELWARHDGDYAFIRTYPILGASGGPGPKLREGDNQVPEGLYNITFLNPNSAFHLSMKLDYPNELDAKHAALEGRNNPGSNIFIHGSSASIGCLAMGNEAIEELFSMTHRIGMQNVSVIIAPRDPRTHALTAASSMPPWTGDLYKTIESAFAPYRR